MHIAAKQVMGATVAAVGLAGLIAGGTAMVVMSREQNRAESDNLTREQPFADRVAPFMAFDADGDSRIDRGSETLMFREDKLGGPQYSSIRAAADAADMVAGNGDGFADRSEFIGLASRYTERLGAVGLNGAEASVFYNDYNIRGGTGSSVDDMRGHDRGGLISPGTGEFPGSDPLFLERLHR